MVNGLQPYFKQISFLEEEGILAANENLELTLIPSWGSNLISLKDKKFNLELLRIPQTREAFLNSPGLYGIPILFPPNRIADGTFSFGKQTYHFEINESEKNNHIHGVVHSLDWELKETKVQDGKVVILTELDSNRFPHIQEQFPHHFIMQMSFILDQNTVYKEATIINKSNQPFPWGLGYHTTFRFPIARNATLDDVTFSLSAEKQWQLNNRLLPTGELFTSDFHEELRRGVVLKGKPLDDVFLSGQPNHAVIFDRKTDLEITYQADENFKHWVVYNGDGYQDFICPEPYTWVTNAPNLKLPPKLTGLQVLEPGEQKTVKSNISIRHRDKK